MDLNLSDLYLFKTCLRHYVYKILIKLMNRTKIAFIKSGDTVRFAKDNDNSDAFFCWGDTYNRFSYPISSAYYTRQNRKLLPFNRVVFAINNRILICTSASKIYLVFFVAVLEFDKPHFIHKPISWALFFQFYKTSINSTHCFSPWRC